MNKNDITVVINTKNSAETLEDCLKSVRALNPVILIVDMYSTDETVKIAKKYTDYVYSHEDVGYVEPARNFALSKVKTEWILVLDSDERITPECISFINESVLQEAKYDVYKLARKNMVFNKWIQHTGWWPDYQVRLFRKGSVRWTDEIHSQPQITGSVKEVEPTEQLAIYHNNYPTVESYIDRLQRYTSITAAQPDKQVEIKSPGAAALKAFRKEFISRLFAHNGVKDGDHGVILALLQGLYETVVIAKVWQNKSFTSTSTNMSEMYQELRKLSEEMRYWVASEHIQNSTGLKQLYWKVRRKLRK